MAGPAGEDNELTVVSGGLLEKALTVDAVPHGTVTFKLSKEELVHVQPANIYSAIFAMSMLR